MNERNATLDGVHNSNRFRFSIMFIIIIIRKQIQFKFFYQNLFISLPLPNEQLSTQNSHIRAYIVFKVEFRDTFNMDAEIFTVKIG